MEELLRKIRDCRECATALPHHPRPIVAASKSSRLVIVGQAPGRRVHESGSPWDDPSGDRLRDWLGVSKAQFYDPGLVALLPMGFCYPGTGKSGDLPPRRECAPLWHQPVLSMIQNPELILLVGSYAQRCYLKGYRGVTDSVKRWKEFQPRYFPLPHPSPRNNLWIAKNPWFRTEVLSPLQQLVSEKL